MQRLLFLIIFLPTVLFAQQSEKAPNQDVWQPLQYLIDTWEGTSKGEPGEGVVQREYHFIMNNKFIEVKNKSTYAPQEKNPKGEVHEDYGIISFDKTRKIFVLRQFHIEGFINQYAQDSISDDGKSIIFTSESIENIASGWRARETYNFISNDTLVETFALAAPGKDFKVYSESRLHRTQANKTGEYKPVYKFDPNRDAAQDIKDAIIEATKSNRRIILDVGGNWCKWCKRLDTLFLENKDLTEFMHKNYVVVKVNFSKENENETVLSMYPEIKGYPHMFVLEKDGKLIYSQDTGELESGKGYSREKVFEFLKKWVPLK